MARSQRPLLAAMIVPALLATTPLAAQVVEEAEPSGRGLVLPKGFVLTPSLAILGFYDDNVFVTASAPQESTGARLTAGLGVSVPAGPHLAFSGSYNVSSDWFADIPELDDLIASQSAILAVAYRAGRRTNVSALAGYSMSRRPQDVLPEIGLAFGREPTERYSAGLGAQRQVGRGGQIGVRYSYDILVYARRSVEERPSESWTATWTQEIARRTSVSGSGGVRNIEGTFTPTYSFGIAHSRRRSSWSLSYSRGHYTIPTLEGASDSESLSAAAGFQIGQSLSIGISPRVSQNADSVRLARNASVSATVSYAVGRSLSLRASYRGTIQRVEGPLESGVRSAPDLAHNVFHIGVAWSRPYRVR